MTLRKLERDRNLAELASLDVLIQSLSDEDVMSRMGLEARRNELQELVANAVHEVEEATASAALYFGGRPVVGQKGIESEFAGQVVSKFQDLVSKLVVQQGGDLGQRGPVPNKAASTMHITNVVRGSFGFLMEEVQPQGQLIGTALVKAVDTASRLMVAFGDADEEQFQSAVEEVDQRVLSTAGELFSLLAQNGATMRLVAGSHDDAFGPAAVQLALERADATQVTEDFETKEGQLEGVLPEGHMFEFRLSQGDVVRGRVDQTIPPSELMNFNLTLLRVPAQAELKVRRVWKEGDIVRETYTLLRITPVDLDPALLEKRRDD